MSRIRLARLGCVALALCALTLPACKKNSKAPAGTGGALDGKKKAPEFTSMDKALWAGAPLSLAKARGKVVLVKAWHPS